MSDNHCILDASALLKKYRPETGSDIITALFNRKDCAIHILNVTIPEITGAFVKWQLSGSINQSERLQLLKLFIADIQEYNVVVHNITHRNIVYTDMIWDNSITVNQPMIKNKTGTTPKPRVGPVDVLVLSVACELKKSYGQSYLLTVDEHMISVAQIKLGLKVINPEKVSKLSFK
jgi:PIN domain nuclease of toxin-antitoxin system